VSGLNVGDRVRTLYYGTGAVVDLNDPPDDASMAPPAGWVGVSLDVPVEPGVRVEYLEARYLEVIRP